MVYTIVALPQDDQLHKLNTIRNYFYQNGFRQRVSKCKENAHITLLQLKDSLSKNFWSEVESSLINTRKIIPAFAVEKWRRKINLTSSPSRCPSNTNFVI